MDLVTELWVDGRLVVDHVTGELGLAPPTRALLAAPNETDAVQSKSERWQLAYEPISGRMVPLGRTVRRVRADGVLQVPLVHGRDETDLPASELVRAVQVVADERVGEGGAVRVLAVGFGSPELVAASELRWLQVDATVRLDDDSGRVHAEIHTEPYLTAAGRREVSAHLAELADEYPDLPFVRQLKARSRPSLRARPGLQSLLDELTAKIGGLEETEANQVPLKHGELESLASRARQALARKEERRMAVTALYGIPSHRSAVVEMLGRARRQVVVGVAGLDYWGLAEIFTAAEEALDGGVQLALLTGRSRDTALSAKVVTALSDLKTRFGDRFIWSAKSALSNARFAVQDDRRALVACSDFLVGPTDPDRPSHEPGLLVEPIADDPQPVIEDLLEFARIRFPDYLVGQSILTLHEHFSAPGDRSDYRPALGEGSRIPSGIGSAADRPTIELWAKSWISHVDDLCRRANRTEAGIAPIEVLTGNQHIDALWSAVRSDDPVVIASRSISGSALGDGLQDALGERVESTALRYTRIDRASDEAAEQLAERADVRRIGFPARVLLSGRTAVVTSFDLLSTNRQERPGFRRPADLGLQVTDGLVCRDLAARLNATHRLPVAVETEAEERSLVELEVLDVLVQARAGGPQSFGDRLVELMPEIVDPWHLLREWQSVVSATELRIAAAVVCHHAEDDSRERSIWLEYLTVDAWRRRSFVEASLLVGHRQYSSDRITPAQAAAAAAIDIGPLAGAWVDIAVAITDLTPEAQGVVAMCVLTELARHAEHDEEAAASMCLAEYERHLPRGWRRLADLVRDFREQSSRSMPLDAAEDLLERAQRQQRDLGRWREVSEKMKRLEASRRMLNFGPGAVLHRDLFSAQGLGSRLIRAAEGDRSEWRSLSADLPVKVRPVFDKIVASHNMEPVSWSRHLPYLRDFDWAIAQARRLLAGAGETGVGSDGAARDTTIEWLRETTAGGKAADLADLLLTEARALPEPLNWPALAAYEVFAALLGQLAIGGDHG